tara:strand:+ start:104 stop:1441 length:1338 start_codon:yes stop_codon:yes gene_type:complete
MFRQPRAEQFEYYRALQSQGARPTEIKRQAKMRRRKKTKDQFARERRAEQAFKFGERRYGLSGRTIFQGTRSQDVDKRRSQYRPDRLLALHQSSLNNATRDAREVQRGLSSVGTTLGLEAKQVETEKAKTQLLLGLSKRISSGEPLLGYAPHRDPTDLNAGKQRAKNYKLQSDEQTRANIYAGILGGQGAIDFLNAQDSARQGDLGYREHRRPSDLNRTSSSASSSSVGVADIEELPPTPRPEGQLEKTTSSKRIEQLNQEAELSSTSSLEKKEKRKAFLSKEPQDDDAVFLKKPSQEPTPEPEPAPPITQPKPKPKPKAKLKPVKAKGKVEEVKDDDDPVEEPLLEFKSGEYESLKLEKGKITDGSDKEGWAETPYEFIDVKGQIGTRKRGQKYYVMGAKGKSYQIVATNKPKLAGWNTISKTKMDKLVGNQELTFLDTFGNPE